MRFKKFVLGKKMLRYRYKGQECGKNKIGEIMFKLIKFIKEYGKRSFLKIVFLKCDIL